MTAYVKTFKGFNIKIYTTLKKNDSDPSRGQTEEEVEDSKSVDH